MRKVEILVDTLNSKRGTAGELINDPTLRQQDYGDRHQSRDHHQRHLQRAEARWASWSTTTRSTLAPTRLSTGWTRSPPALDEGKGSAGKLLKDDTLYNNLNAAVANANQMVAEINAGKGAMGKLAKDPAFAQKLDDTVTRLDNILTSVDEGKGTLGQLVKNRSLYEHADQTMDQAQQLVQEHPREPQEVSGHPSETILSQGETGCSKPQFETWNNHP